MLRFTLFIAFLLSSILVFGQEETNEKPFSSTSIELSGGWSNPIRPFTSGYYSQSMKYTGLQLPNHLELGFRYMLNPKFGFRLNAGYSAFSESSTSDSPEFSTEQIRLNTGLVLNLGRAFNFESFSKRLGLLADVGVFYARFGDVVKEDNGGWYWGITPQFKLSDRFALHANFSAYHGLRQHLTWNGMSANSTSLESLHYVATFGITFYPKSGKKHADWFFREDTIATNETTEVEVINDLDKRISKLEEMLKDSDQDGVADYLDVEPNTPSGVFVNTRGQRTNIAELFDFDKSKIVNFQPSTQQLAEQLMDQKRHILFFEFNNVELIEQSKINLAFIAEYLIKFPEVKIEIVGYTDPVGQPTINEKLSLRRAQRVKQLLIRNHINADNISVRGGGVYKSVIDSNDNLTHPISRRVEISFITN